MQKRNLIIVLVTVIIMILTGILIINLVNKVRKQDTSDVMSYTKDEEKQNNETKNLLDDERIVVVLANKNEVEENKIDNQEEQPEETPPKTNNQSQNSQGKKYYIKVNNQANVVTVYTKDSSGNYTVPVKAMICSTGKATPTSGTYEIQWRWEWLGLVGNVYGHYSTQIVGDILFHSVPYLTKYDPSSLEYWEYDKLGTSCSAGCVRLKVEDAKWIFDNVEKGTKVEFYYSSNPGPLRKAKC